jgi:hypothetical protein
MTTATAPAASSTGPMNVFARLVGIITSPKATFHNVVAHPRALGIVAIICLLSAICLGWFFSTQVGRDAWLNSMIERGGAQMTDQQVAAMERMAPYVGYFAIGQALIGVPIFMVLIAGLLYAVFNAAMGGTATFKQVFAVVAHAWVIPAVSQLFTLPLAYAKGEMTSSTSLGVLLPMIDDATFLGKFIGAIDFFLIWGLVVLAIGLAVLYRRKTQSIATTLFVIYGVIALAIAALT